jgi:GNAT superfamily N-acetyltransferase
MELTVHPLTSDRWQDLETLFGPEGAHGGCWCMWWRFTPHVAKARRGEGSRVALRQRVDERRATGLLAYDKGEPVGWVSIAPREEYERIPTSQTWRPIDKTPVWAIVCFFVRREARNQGIATALLDAAVQFAREQGAQIVEAYPKDLDAVGNEPVPDHLLFWGTLRMFQQAGFVEVGRRHRIFPIVRLTL